MKLGDIGILCNMVCCAKHKKLENTTVQLVDFSKYDLLEYFTLRVNDNICPICEKSAHEGMLIVKFLYNTERQIRIMPCQFRPIKPDDIAESDGTTTELPITSKITNKV